MELFGTKEGFFSLVECYKIVFNLNGLNFSDYFELCRNTKSRSKHPYKLQTKLAKLNWYKNSFFVRIIKPWNDLPINVFNFRDSPNVSKFKLRLKNHMNIRGIGRTFAMLRRTTRMHLSQSLVILISITTPNNTWLSAAFPYIKVRRKAARI